MLKQGLREIILTSCLAVVASVRCRDCGMPAQITSRSEYTTIKSATAANWALYQCVNCAVKGRTARQDPTEIKAEQRRGRIVKLLLPAEDHFTIDDFSSLSYTDAFLLYCVLVASGECWQGHEIASLRSQPTKLAPTPEMSVLIYRRLHLAGVLAPALSSDVTKFRFVDWEAYKLGVSPLDVDWNLAADRTGDPIEGLLYKLENVLCHPDGQSVKELWLMVAESECERYFAELCERYRFPKAALYTDKVATSIRYCLTRLSLPQVWNILWCVMRNIAALIQEGTYIRPHIYNMIAGNLRRDVDRRLANEASIRPWGRLRPHEEAVITAVLFDKILRRGNVAFETVTAENVQAYVEGLPEL